MAGDGLASVDEDKSFQGRSREGRGAGLSRPAKRHGSFGRMGEILPVFGRTISSSVMEVGTSPTISLMQERPLQRDQLRSKSMAWKEPILLLQRMSSSRRVPGFFKGTKAARSERQQAGKGSSTTYYVPEHSSDKKPSQWVRFWRKLRFDGGKKVHAARSDWLNYDSQSYAMNFEKDRETPRNMQSQPMPKISGPGARDIVTVLLKRSSSANRNSGGILIPKPVVATSPEKSTPLWKRRSVSAPSSLEVRLRTASMKRRSNSAAA